MCIVAPSGLIFKGVLQICVEITATAEITSKRYIHRVVSKGPTNIGEDPCPCQEKNKTEKNVDKSTYWDFLFGGFL